MADDHEPGRNLVVCCDGTNNQFGRENTNVVRLVQSLDRDPRRQLVFYDPGVGTLPLPGYVSGLTRWMSEVAGLAFGAGLPDKVVRAYRFLMDHQRPNDTVYFFGFSRGAYTIRVLAALLHMYGLLAQGSDNLLPYVMRRFRASRAELRRGDQAAAFWALTDEFRETFARALPGANSRRLVVDFLGAWDTVSSVGWVWDPETYPFTQSNPSLVTVRHAIALDERRAFYRQNRFKAAFKGQDLDERWFAGAHCDVGGGYKQDEGGLWRVAFQWMVDEATAHGLLVDPQALARVLANPPPPARPWAECHHESLTAKWWPAEYFPKLRWNAEKRRRVPRMGLGRPRELFASDVLHESVWSRLRDATPAYQPGNPGFAEALERLQRTSLPRRQHASK
jgi:uncharacterized protein (DUF2235 family)